jgi:hypothetical protein
MLSSCPRRCRSPTAGENFGGYGRCAANGRWLSSERRIAYGACEPVSSLTRGPRPDPGTVAQSTLIRIVHGLKGSPHHPGPLKLLTWSDRPLVLSIGDLPRSLGWVRGP